ncbi:HEAT repeat domain-containing protein [Streptomyces pinistramenti]|uniref:HEAT repeat domain-containing protein n=1 Tax=Streptomyces pinistramenti TaxID=2884812 RepID=UPI001D073841|nr:HEAT repeat domain-containing protein [Streptomyces pinistramenti]MCB5911741.1 HEAT repeat domain-containing protein [Streptomyces pinistramenti]
MPEPNYRTLRYVLHPDTHWNNVGDFADTLGWPLAHEITRNQTEGTDGQMIWQSPSGISLHYVVDATSGIGYVTLAGPDEESVAPFTAQAHKELTPWSLEELFQRFDGEVDPIERGRLTLRIGLAAPPELNHGCLTRILSSLAGDDPRIRLAGLWATTYTGYQEFVPTVRELAQGDPENWLRTRAESVVAAFEDAGGKP